MEARRGSSEATAHEDVRRVTSRRSLLKGLTALMAVGAIAPLAVACGAATPAAARRDQAGRSPSRGARGDNRASRRCPGQAG